MKRTLLSVMVLLGVSAGAHAENLLDIYQQAQIKDPQLLQSKAVRDQAFEKINESRAALLPQINLEDRPLAPCDDPFDRWDDSLN